MKVCLSFVYNHRYEGNIERLEALYRARFSRMFHLMPFYRGSRPNVLRTYRGSHQFQGFVTDAYEHLPREGFSHYLFSADDLLLHPSLDETNLAEQLGLSENCGYIKELTPVTEVAIKWHHLPAGLVAMSTQYNAMWKRELPSSEEALAIMEGLGLRFGHFGLKNCARGVTQIKHLGQALFYFMKRLAHRREEDAVARRTGVPYPALVGYADFVIVPAPAMEKFCHYCGVLAAAEWFVEIALPTALALACKEVRQEKETRWHGLDLFTGNPELCNPYEGRVQALVTPADHQWSIAALERRLADDELYLHPVKFSQWGE